MNTVSAALALKLFSPLRLAGPIFEKELRVASRRKRNYLLRFIYLLLLTVFIVFAWGTAVGVAGSGSAALRASRMAEAGKYITSTIIWFQFIAVQLIAAASLSTAVNEEIHRRTLALLMTTPVNSFQIVAGKLCSRLLQPALLLALTLPALAVVRVFGGVPWDYVVCGLCVTFTAAVFAGSVSLFFSIHQKRASQVISSAFLICILLYAALPALFQLLALFYKQFVVPEAVLLYLNPFMIMYLGSQAVLTPSGAGSGAYWPVHCAVMLGLSAPWLALAAASVRAAGLRQAAGQAVFLGTAKERRHARRKLRKDYGKPTASAVSRPVKGPPIIWKDMRAPLVKGRRLRKTIALTLAVVALSAAYGSFAYHRLLLSTEVQIVFVMAYFFLVIASATGASATSVSSEREAGTWTILLTTPLEEKQIVIQKILAACLRAWPFWLLLAGHVTLFTLAGGIHPVTLVPLTALVLCSVLFMASVGVCCSSTCKRSSTASTVTTIAFMVLVIPVCVPLPSPLFIAAMILGVGAGEEAAATGWRGLEYGLFGTGAHGLLVSMAILLVIIIVYLLLTLAAFAIAHYNIRSKIF